MSLSIFYPRMPGTRDPHPIFNHADMGQLVSGYYYPEESPKAREGWMGLFDDPKELSLECRFIEMITLDLDVYADCGFSDFLSPNELGMDRLAPHVMGMKRGVVVATGAARAQFTYLQTPEDQCTGLIERDINPRTKGYNDFFTLLQRVSTSQRDFLTLWSAHPLEEASEIASRVARIRERIHANSVMPKKMREYYLKHLEDFAEIYFRQNHFPEGEDHHCSISYQDDPAIFARLQRLAIQGNMVSTIGDIGDLSFLPGEEISVVDTSNIHDYTILNLRGSGLFQPRVIWTICDVPTRYFSYIHHSLTPDEQIEYDDYLRQLTNSPDPTSEEKYQALELLLDYLIDIGSNVAICKLLLGKLGKRSRDGTMKSLAIDPWFVYSRNTLILLREYLPTYFENLDMPDELSELSS